MMLKCLPWMGLAAAQIMQPMVGDNAAGLPAMNPLILSLLMKDGSDLSSILPLLMSNGQMNNGQPISPLILTKLLDDKDGNNDSSLKKLLPLLLMNGNGNNGVNMMENPVLLLSLLDKDSNTDDLIPLLMMNNPNNRNLDPITLMTLLDDDKKCEIKNANLNNLINIADADKKLIAVGDKLYDKINDRTVEKTHEFQAADFIDYIDYSYMACVNKKAANDDSDLLPIMLMMNGNPNMDMNMMIALLNSKDGSSSLTDLIPFLMQTNSNGGTNSNMITQNPLFMSLLLKDEVKSRVACDKKFPITKFITWKNNPAGNFVIDEITTKIRERFQEGQAEFVSNTLLAEYSTCLKDATVEQAETTSISDLLPLLMMNQRPNGNMENPFMMAAMLENE